MYGTLPFRLWTAAAWAVVGGLLSIAATIGAEGQSDFTRQRQQLVTDVVAQWVKDARVLDAVRTTPRHEFVPSSQRKLSYYDMALPIGNKQTISSPLIVASMTEALQTSPMDRVLEIGTGSGYQAAVLSPLVAEVYTIEIVTSLGRKARRTLKRLLYENVHVKIGDGYQGWVEHAPFDKIIVTCSPEKVPPLLVKQLKEGGRMVIPVGQRYRQMLYLLEKRDGKLQETQLQPTLFVPMTGEAEDQREVLPDPANPRAKNGSFDEPANALRGIPGWYYEAQVRLVESDEPDNQGNYALFENKEPGRACRLLQGLAVDGRKVLRLNLSIRIKLDSVRPGPREDMQPMLAITFYDDQRRDLGMSWLGPWRGTTDWHSAQGDFRVPVNAREAILRLGLFGATGSLVCDDVVVTAVRSKP